MQSALAFGIKKQAQAQAQKNKCIKLHLKLIKIVDKHLR